MVTTRRRRSVFALRKWLWQCRACVKLILKMRVATGSTNEVFELHVFHFLMLIIGGDERGDMDGWRVKR